MVYDYIRVIMKNGWPYFALQYNPMQDWSLIKDPHWFAEQLYIISSVADNFLGQKVDDKFCRMNIFLMLDQ